MFWKKKKQNKNKKFKLNISYKGNGIISFPYQHTEEVNHIISVIREAFKYEKGNSKIPRRKFIINNDNQLEEMTKRIYEMNEPILSRATNEELVKEIKRRIEFKDKFLSLNDYVEKIHQTAKEKGWWNDPREAGTIHMLMVSEIAEATEEVRNNSPAIYGKGENEDGESIYSNEISGIKAYNLKPEGEAVELMDCVIRIMDYFGAQGWNFEEILNLKLDYNKTRSFRHGGKSF
jgi:hypothetical protein